MMEYPQVKDNLTLIKDNIGNYIQFEGKGIVDGLNHPPCKNSLLKILGFGLNGELRLRRYRAKKGCYLPSHEYNQGFRLFTKKGFQKLSVY